MNFAEHSKMITKFIKNNISCASQNDTNFEVVAVAVTFFSRRFEFLARASFVLRIASPPPDTTVVIGKHFRGKPPSERLSCSTRLPFLFIFSSIQGSSNSVWRRSYRTASIRVQPRKSGRPYRTQPRMIASKHAVHKTKWDPAKSNHQNKIKEKRGE